MKKAIIIASLLVIAMATTAQSVTNDTVYVTRTGTKYHLETCQYAKTATAVHLDETKLMPCKRCVLAVNHNPTATVRPATVCAGSTKTGNPCKRKTTDESGKCFNHRTQ